MRFLWVGPSQLEQQEKDEQRTEKIKEGGKWERREEEKEEEEEEEVEMKPVFVDEGRFAIRKDEAASSYLSLFRVSEETVG